MPLLANIIYRFPQIFLIWLWGFWFLEGDHERKVWSKLYEAWSTILGAALLTSLPESFSFFSALMHKMRLCFIRREPGRSLALASSGRHLKKLMGKQPLIIARFWHICIMWDVIFFFFSSNTQKTGFYNNLKCPQFVKCYIGLRRWTILAFNRFVMWGLLEFIISCQN